MADLKYREAYLGVVKNKLREGNPAWILRQGLKYAGILLGSKIKRQLCGPVLASLFVTYRCNLQCAMCDLWRKPKEYREMGLKEFDTEKMKRVLMELKDIGTTGVGFTGGEPLVREDIYDLLGYAKKMGMITHLNTNALMLDMDAVLELKKINVDSINISLDGSKEETHDAIRGAKGSFKKVLEGVSLINKARQEGGFPVKLNLVAVLSRQNISEAVDMVRLTKEIGADAIGFMPVNTDVLNRDKEDRKMALNADADAADAIIDTLITLKKEGEPIDNTERYLSLFKNCFRGEKSPVRCLAGYNTIAVDCYGDVFPCFPWAELGRKVANIESEKLKGLWKSNSYKKTRQATSECHECYWNCQTELNLLFN